MGTNRHRKRVGEINRKKRNLWNLAPLELNVAELMQDHVCDRAIASLLGINRKRVRILKKSFYQKTECRTKQDLDLFLDVYRSSVKNSFRILE